MGATNALEAFRRFSGIAQGVSLSHARNAVHFLTVTRRCS